MLIGLKHKQFELVLIASNFNRHMPLFWLAFEPGTDFSPFVPPLVSEYDALKFDSKIFKRLIPCLN